VGKSETVDRVPYLENVKQKDDGSTRVCLRFMLLMIMNVWIEQVTFGTEVNCNNLAHYLQNDSSFKLFKHEAIVILSMSLLLFRYQINGLRSIHFP
jgi:hypothetical protein